MVLLLLGFYAYIGRKKTLKIIPLYDNDKFLRHHYLMLNAASYQSIIFIFLLRRELTNFF